MDTPKVTTILSLVAVTLYIGLIGTTWSTHWHKASVNLPLGNVSDVPLKATYYVGLWKICVKVDLASIPPMDQSGKQMLVNLCSYTYDLFMVGNTLVDTVFGMMMQADPNNDVLRLLADKARVPTDFLVTSMVLMGMAYVGGLLTVLAHVVWCHLRDRAPTFRKFTVLPAAGLFVTGCLAVSSALVFCIKWKAHVNGLLDLIAKVTLTPSPYADVWQGFPNGSAYALTLSVACLMVLLAGVIVALACLAGAKQQHTHLAEDTKALLDSPELDYDDGPTFKKSDNCIAGGIGILSEIQSDA